MTYLSLILFLAVTFFPMPVEVLADIGTSLTALATTFAGFLVGALALVGVVSGYQLMTAGDDIQRAAQAKRALGLALAGALLVGTAIALAPTIVGDIK